MNKNQFEQSDLGPIIWHGDLSDDCTAEWAGLMLRAEWMDGDWWWWAVYDMTRDEITIDDSNEYADDFIGGDTAREKAEAVAIAYIRTIKRRLTAKYLISDVFKITGPRLVLAGHITEGSISVNDFIAFIVFGLVLNRQIMDIKEIEFKTVLLIRCDSEDEMNEICNWTVQDEPALIFNQTLEIP